MDDRWDRFPGLIENVNQIGVELLSTDADLALTFLSVAERGDSTEAVERNVRNARKAYDSIQRLRQRYSLTDVQARALNSKLHEVRKRLRALGSKSESRS